MPLIVLPSDSQFPADDLYPGDASSLEREDSLGRVAIEVAFRGEAEVEIEVGGGMA
jgi:hypothetical protein